MSTRLLCILLLISYCSCKANQSDMEVCFENIQNRIKSDSILIKLMHSDIEQYGDFASIISRAVEEESKSDTICSKTIDIFFSANSQNSTTVNNLILFQQFQSYLKHEKFNKSKAREIAIEYEKKWK
jgi:hypothetical protein